MQVNPHQFFIMVKNRTHSCKHVIEPHMDIYHSNSPARDVAISICHWHKYTFWGDALYRGRSSPGRTELDFVQSAVPESREKQEAVMLNVGRGLGVEWCGQ